MKVKRIVSALLAAALVALLAVPAFAASGINAEEQRILDAINTEVNGIKVLDTSFGRDVYGEVRSFLMMDDVDLDKTDVDGVVGNINKAIALAEELNITTSEQLFGDIDVYSQFVAYADAAVGAISSVSVSFDSAGNWTIGKTVSGGSGSGKPVNQKKPLAVLDNEKGEYNGSGDYAVRIDAEPADLLAVYCNGELLQETRDYTVSEGSTIITLTPEFLATLGKGTYTLTIDFAGDFQATAIVEVLVDGSNVTRTSGTGSKKTAIAETGDTTNAVPYVVAIVLALAGGTALVVRKKVHG